MTDEKINNNGFEFIDLGLPSGTLWSTANVGASEPTDFGMYFRWGDLQGYKADQVGENKQFNWEDYEWEKYRIPKATLDLEDDAANHYMGGSWHMPSYQQIKELMDNTISKWANLNCIKGYLLTSRNGKSIFIPAAGYMSPTDGSVRYRGTDCNIWTSMLDTLNDDYGQYLYLYLGGANFDSSLRDVGFSVRGVIG